MKFMVGFISGILISSIGIQGIARLADNGITRFQEIAKESAK